MVEKYKEKTERPNVIIVMPDVEINGQNFGTLWYAPFVVDVTEALKPEDNLEPSGLLGPVKITPVASVTIRE